MAGRMIVVVVVVVMVVVLVVVVVMLKKVAGLKWVYHVHYPDRYC